MSGIAGKGPVAARAAGRLIYGVPPAVAEAMEKRAWYPGNLPEAPIGFAWVAPGEVPPENAVYFIGDGRCVSFSGLAHVTPTRGPVKYAGDKFFSGFARLIE